MSVLEVPAFVFGLLPLLGSTAAPEGDGASQGSPPVPLLVLGHGGGFTGAVGGYRLFPDGTLLRWEQLPGRPERTQPCGKLSPEQFAKLREALAGVDWSNIPEGEPGNVTSFIAVALPSGTREIRWAGLYDDAPPPLRPLFSLALPWFEACETQR